ncbi:hypothetical protein EFK50_18340 [Nocardioides marmoriginsengisoli]|uniref:DUF7507 domain-containing protein n=1 Tax=Nocardioides marmoriginsengisoli TaxID=661483 RepID=A0A3N0CCY4_9ACTN|nr:hypothetical protein EFK50_18340 [Nocardioides marmoriginsengisoli]
MISAGPTGFVELEWVPCNYDLEVKKSVTKVKIGKKGSPGRDNVVRVGDYLDWRIQITNRGPNPMTRGDVVDLVDSRAATASLRIRELRVSGGSGATSLASQAVTCNAAVGQLLPATLLCSRPYLVQPSSLLDGAAQPGGVRGLNNGETLTVVYRERVVEAAKLTNTATVTDRAAGQAERSDAAAAGLQVIKGKQSLKLVKTATPSRVTKKGQKISYRFVVKNTGTVGLNGISIEERRFTGTGTAPVVRCPKTPVTLRPGASVVCKATYRATQDDVRAGRIVNRAVAHGTSPDGNDVRSNVGRAVVKGKLPAPPVTGGRA